VKIFLRIVLLLCLADAVRAGETWQAALSRMPLACGAGELNRTNCVPLLLNAFQSNGVVKALVFLPGATDELYFFRRVHATVTSDHPSLLDAVVALTNQTFIRADFRPPLLLLHTSEDPSNVIAVVKNSSTAAKLRRRQVPGRVLLEDADWGQTRAALRGKLCVGLRPFENAVETWHFYRFNLAACGATDWELLEALAFAGRATFTVHWFTADFQLDRRAGPPPKLNRFPESSP
jgi:hypothetical protein